MRLLWVALLMLDYDTFMLAQLRWRDENDLADDEYPIAYVGREQWDQLRYSLHGGNCDWTPSPEGGEVRVGGVLIVRVHRADWLDFSRGRPRRSASSPPEPRIQARPPLPASAASPRPPR